MPPNTIQAKSPLEEKILQALADVKDPAVGADIVEAIKSVAGVEDVIAEVVDHQRAGEIEAALNGEA